MTYEDLMNQLFGSPPAGDSSQQLANTLYRYFSAFLAAGFSRDEALAVLMALFTAAMTKES